MDPEHAVRTTLELHELVVRAWCSGIARLCGRFPFSGTNPGVDHAISPGVLLFRSDYQPIATTSYVEPASATPAQLSAVATAHADTGKLLNIPIAVWQKLPV
jgi:hypothetical protein